MTAPAKPRCCADRLPLPSMFVNVGALYFDFNRPDLGAVRYSENGECGLSESASFNSRPRRASESEMWPSIAGSWHPSQ